MIMSTMGKAKWRSNRKALTGSAHGEIDLLIRIGFFKGTRKEGVKELGEPKRKGAK